MIGGHELAVIFLIILVVMGPKHIPEAARLMARLMRHIRDAKEEIRKNLIPDEVEDLRRDFRKTWQAPKEFVRKEMDNLQRSASEAVETKESNGESPPDAGATANESAGESPGGVGENEGNPGEEAPPSRIEEEPEESKPDGKA